MDNGEFLADDGARFAPLLAITQNATHYNMGHKNRGMALIFNHENFHRETHQKSRIGTNVDADDVAIAFNKLDFDVTVYRDLEYTRLMEIVGNAATFDHTDYDCFVMVVLTHGGENNILYSYDKSYKFQNLWKPFSANLCRSLAGKPKIFFVQACRGNKYMSPVSLNITETDGPSNHNITSYKIPSEADFLFAFSTIPGYYSWRNTDHGSWFIQALCKELEKSSYKSDILTILTSVNRRVAIDYPSCKPEDFAAHQRKQISTFESRLTRQLQFTRKGENLDIAVEEVTPWHQPLSVEDMKDIVMLFMKENTSVNRNEVERIWNDLMNGLNSCGSGRRKEVCLEIFANLIRVTKCKIGTNLTPLEDDLQDISDGVVVCRCPAAIEKSLNQTLEQASSNEIPIDELPENENVIQEQRNILAVSIDNYAEVKRQEIDLRERELQFKIQKMKLIRQFLFIYLNILLFILLFTFNKKCLLHLQDY